MASNITEYRMHLRLGISLLLLLCAQQVNAEMRSWTLRSGQQIEAEYLRNLFDNVVVRDAAGRESKIPLSAFSDGDLDYIELLNPPELDVDFRESFKQVHVSVSPYISTIAPPTLKYYQFGAYVKQTSSRSYNRKLRLEIYALTRQKYDPDKYHLIARLRSDPFVLSAEKGRTHEFMARERFKIVDYYLTVSYLAWEEVRGEELAENLVLVRDERDEIIAYSSSKKWLFDHLDKLQALPVGAWIDKTCTRVHPTSPKDVKSGQPPG